MRVRSRVDGDISVNMGSPRVLADRPIVTAAPMPARAGARLGHDARTRTSSCEVVGRRAGGARPRRGRRRRPAAARAGRTSSSSSSTAPRHLRMRVHERGVGRDPVLRNRHLRCGGRRRDARSGRAPTARPGRSTSRAARAGRLARRTGRWRSTGPAVLVAEFELDDAWLASVGASSPIAADRLFGWRSRATMDLRMS